MLYQNDTLRKILLPLMKRFSFDFTIGHHWLPGARVRLNLFQHKGYWYHGKDRERDTMEAFARLIPDGGTVIEVGGHIGYISAYLAALVGPRGRVIVFEPGPNNQPYLQRNIAGLANVEWIDRAVSDEVGTVTFYCDNLTGQNNSLVADFKVLEANAGRTGIAVERAEVQVEAITLDAFCEARRLVPDFVKIDVEGAELLVVRGMRSLLRGARPRLMVEKNDEDEAELERELAAAGYVFLSPRLEPSGDGRMHFGNNFCVPTDDPLLAEAGRGG
ncbi:MAG TPA: FkbM family methyltransferase [Allosphingosinicella sp.]|nr:FkbM family methyltransferase [Allosphingosinicella sp.]